MSRALRCIGGISLLLASQASASCSRQPAPGPTAAALYKANAELIRALRDEDLPSFLDKFSEAGTWTILSTHAVVPADLRMTRAELARELEAKGQMHSFMFGPRPWALRAFTVAPYDKPWQPLNAVQLGPPDVRRGEVLIAWRQEGAKWVVDAIAWPIQ
jgi:hypothetical protein